MGVRLDNLRVQRISANLTVSELARRSNTSDLIINTLESPGKGALGLGGTTTHDAADRICSALSISRATAGFVDMGGT